MYVCAALLQSRLASSGKSYALKYENSSHKLFPLFKFMVDLPMPAQCRAIKYSNGGMWIIDPTVTHASTSKGARVLPSYSINACTVYTHPLGYMEGFAALHRMHWKALLGDFIDRLHIAIQDSNMDDDRLRQRLSAELTEMLEKVPALDEMDAKTKSQFYIKAFDVFSDFLNACPAVYEGLLTGFDKYMEKSVAFWDSVPSSGCNTIGNWEKRRSFFAKRPRQDEEEDEVDSECVTKKKLRAAEEKLQAAEQKIQATEKKLKSVFKISVQACRALTVAGVQLTGRSDWSNQTANLRRALEICGVAFDGRDLVAQAAALRMHHDMNKAAINMLGVQPCNVSMYMCAVFQQIVALHGPAAAASVPAAQLTIPALLQLLQTVKK
jgi:cytochrome c5